MRDQSQLLSMLATVEPMSVCKLQSPPPHNGGGRDTALPQVAYKTSSSSTLLDGASASSSGVMRAESTSSAPLLMRSRATYVACAYETASSQSACRSTS